VKKNLFFFAQTGGFIGSKEGNAVSETSCGRSFLFIINEAIKHLDFDRSTLTFLSLSIYSIALYFYGVQILRVFRIISSSKAFIILYFYRVGSVPEDDTLILCPPLTSSPLFKRLSFYDGYR